MHEQFMYAALDQAKQGLGICAPNPCVGAVAVLQGKIIAQAYHKGAGTSHAEQLVLSQLPPKLPGVSLYITLEPCNHWGRTPPCTNAIIDYGIEEVYFAYLDPNPVVKKNDTTTLLQANGVKVHHLQLPEIDEFYQSYVHWVYTNRPMVCAKIAQTLDGRIGLREKRVVLSNDLCLNFTHQQRMRADVLLTSANTILCDNPKMNVRLDGKEYPKIVAIIDRNLTLRVDAQVFKYASHCHLFHSAQSIPPEPYKNCSYHAIPEHEGRLDLDRLIAQLGVLGFHRVWVEVGGALFGALHAQGLVDKTFIYLVPGSQSEDAVSAYQQPNIFNRHNRISWLPMGNNMILCMDWIEKDKNEQFVSDN